ncbi:RVT_3 domain-containing protein [Cephalotus follicularis]|uniref:RVT_3 domain-containing protein n=1 Tax=Cephalotus follicularis TaxID=3775 RepID=A0A1Q3CN86_CEPFO|nr:RVT_3 domain-containing protein [Cephalotus follicularis]
MPREVKMNCDGAVYRDGSCSGLGWVFLDWEEIVIVAANRRLVPQNDAPTTEDYGMLCGKQLGYHRLIVESDASVIVDALNNLVYCDVVYGNIIDDIRELQMGFEACIFCYISREDNNLVHITVS